ncbi:MAG: penicillin-insensitive murein endopeptidase [Deltaproteobacteria bacterium]|nr:penicillin-insensitive murein endopeptidase [Deltaproteobacteria bacterium]
MTKARAKALLTTPRGSISVGTTGSGSLHEAAELPVRGAGYAVFGGMRSRHTNYGTDELVRLIERAAREMAKRYPGSVLGVGNLGNATGGKIPWSVSHRAGRDADIGMFALDRKGAHVNQDGFHRFGADLEAQGGRYRFDLERNLALVRALLADEATQIQWIFVAEWLKRPLLAEAARQGATPAELARLDAVLHQPSDSNPHADHFHIRLYCSFEDRCHGCVDWGPIHDGVDLRDADFDAFVDELCRVVTDLDAPKLQRRALERLEAVRSPRAVPTLLATLSSDRDALRRAALRALRAVGVGDAVPGLLAALLRVRDPAWAGELFDVVLGIDHPDALAVAMTALETPERLFAPEVAARVAARARIGAAEVAGRLGQKEAAEALFALLSSPDGGVRQAAHEALRAVTNQDIPGRGLESRREARRAKVVAAWRAFLDAQRDESWLQWQRLGFEARGIRFHPKMGCPEGVEKLIGAITHRDRVLAANALRVLGELTGHVDDGRRRSARNNQRHWRTWWDAHKSEVAFP